MRFPSHRHLDRGWTQLLYGLIQIIVLEIVYPPDLKDYQINMHNVYKSAQSVRIKKSRYFDRRYRELFKNVGSKLLDIVFQQRNRSLNIECCYYIMTWKQKLVRDDISSHFDSCLRIYAHFRPIYKFSLHTHNISSLQDGRIILRNYNVNYSCSNYTPIK